jgi:hypothetical protein
MRLLTLWKSLIYSVGMGIGLRFLQSAEGLLPGALLLVFLAILLPHA